MKMSSDFPTSLSTLEVDDILARNRAMVDAELDRLLPSETDIPSKIHEAIRWSVFAGGKRFRPGLVIVTGQTFNAPVEKLVKTACAFEMIHTYSLIHDDLPSMDDDDLRRGRSTCHIRFDEATAILAGDALQTLAFGAIAKDANLDTETRVALIGELADAAGTPLGMVAGQALDIEAEARAVSDRELEDIHRRKTGALMIAAARAGAMIGRASRHELEAITLYASYLGLLFQITDDLLDVTATAEDLGKTPGKDARSHKATYPGLYGVDRTREAARRAHHSACASLDQIGGPDTLKRIADFILNRTT